MTYSAERENGGMQSGLWIRQYEYKHHQREFRWIGMHQLKSPHALPKMLQNAALP